MCGTDVLVKVSEVCGTVCSRFGTFGPHVALGHCWCRSDGVLPLARNSHVTPLARHATRTSRNSYVTPLVRHATRMSRHSYVTPLVCHATRTALATRSALLTPRHSHGGLHAKVVRATDNGHTVPHTSDHFTNTSGPHVAERTSKVTSNADFAIWWSGAVDGPSRPGYSSCAVRMCW